MIGLMNKIQDMLDMSKALDFLGPLALRLYLAPVFWVAGTNKMNGFEDVVSWFGNAEWGLGLPMPWLMAFLATSAEVVGAVMLIMGFGVRWVSIPLMITMLVAAFAVHWENGWQAVADAKSPWPPEDIAEAGNRLDAAKSILQEHGNYDWLTGSGSFVISNNGIEWAATYFVMLLALFFMGGGKYLSADYWIARKFRR
ncbi:MAG: DoxX family protein [Gammaproteobacteria bacterium]|nr:DoxX family protein [Gammaproteobacteria bacterium]